MEGYGSCQEYKGCSARHSIDAKELVEKANKSYRSVYIPMACTILSSDQPVQLDGCIKSIDPPSTGQACSYGDHPYTCENCPKQLRDLRDTLRHREKGNLGGRQDRIGFQAFNQRYTRSCEMESVLKTERKQSKVAEQNFAELTSVKLSVVEWERSLMDTCLSCDEEKLILDQICLFKMGMSKAVSDDGYSKFNSKIEQRKQSLFGID